MKKIVYAFEYMTAVAIVLVVCTVVVGACAALLPVRWVIDWSARKQFK